MFILISALIDLLHGRVDLIEVGVGLAIGALQTLLQVDLGVGGIGQNNAGNPILQLLIGILDIQVLSDLVLGQLEAQDIAVGIAIQDVLLVQVGMLTLGQIVQIIDVVLRVLVLLTVGQLQIRIIGLVVLLNALDLAGHGLGLEHLADNEVVLVLIIVQGEDNIVILFIALDIEVVVVQNLALGGQRLHGNELAVIIGLHAGDLAQAVVDLNQGNGLVVNIDINFSHNALAGVGIIAALVGGVHGLFNFHAVDKELPGVLIDNSLTQVAVDILLLGALGVDIGGLDGSEGADLGLLVLPGVGGTAIDAVGDLQLQLGEVLLGELDVAVLLDVAVSAGGNVPLDLVGQGSADGDLSAVHVGDDLLIILHHGGLQGVQGIQASLFTGNSLVAVEGVLQALVQADADGLLSDLDAEGAGVVVALDVGVIAQSAQQHLHEGIAGQRTGGTEGTVAVAADDALVGAVGDVASKNVVGGNVAEGSDSGAQLSGSGGAEDQVADDLGSLTTVQGSLGLEGTVGITVDDLHSGQHGDGFVIVDFVSIREVLGAGADGDQRHGHNQSQNQRKELLHVVFSSFKIFAKRAGLLCSPSHGIGG